MILKPHSQPPMKILTFLIAPLAALLLTSPLSARLGETKEQIIKRYGEPEERDDEFSDRHESFLFSVSNYSILVTFLDGVSHGEFYTKLDDEDFSETEISRLLEINGGGKEWEVAVIRGNHLFNQGEELYGAASGSQLFVQTKELKKYEESLKVEKNKKNLEML